MPAKPYHHNLQRAGQIHFPGLPQYSLLEDERCYFLDISKLVSVYYPNISATVTDLLDIAASVAWADRNDKRPSRQTGTYRQYRGWARDFHLTIGVREPDIWNDAQVKAALEQLLFWLTEDIWHLSFVHEPVRRVEDIKKSLLDEEVHDGLIVLYSGGLDSLAGVVKLRQMYPEREIVLLSVTAYRLAKMPKRHYLYLQSALSEGKPMHCAQLQFHLVHDKDARGEQEREEVNEKSQRTRGFLFFACGLAQAIAYNSNHIITCENGVGMFNLPFNKRQLGTQHTRSVHPQTILQFNRLLSLLHLSSIRYEAPFISLTKGQLCQDLRLSGYGHLCAHTVSCDSFPIRIKRPIKEADYEWHCGMCTSCLLRRQSIFAAHLEHEENEYIYQRNVCHPGWIKKRGDDEALLMMLDQITSFQQLLAADAPISRLLYEFPELYMACYAIDQEPELFGLDAKTKSDDMVVDLLRHYVDEWTRFPYQLA